MNNNLHDDIDAFFLGNLKEYAEAPAEAVWSEINKKLSSLDSIPFLKQFIAISTFLFVR